MLFRSIVERALIVPPRGKIGPIAPADRQAIIKSSVLFGTYETAVNRESAAEKLRARVTGQTAAALVQPAPVQGSQPAPTAPAASGPGIGSAIGSILLGATGPRGGHQQGLIEAAAKSAVRSIGSGVGRSIVRGLLGSLFSGRR